MKRSSLPLPSVGEALLYLKGRGLRRACGKLARAYLGGRERWYLTIEHLTHWIGTSLAATTLVVREARLDDLARMAGFTERQHVKTLSSWFGPDFVFFIALADGRPIAYRCLGRQVHREVQGIVSLAPHQLFMIDEFTVPAFRRRGITRSLAVATNPTLLARGVREIVGLHSTDNDNTIAATRAKGIATIGTLSCLRIGWMTWFTYQPRDPSVVPPLAPAVRSRRHETGTPITDPREPARAA